VVRCATLNLTEDELEIAFLEISDGGRPPCLKTSGNSLRCDFLLPK